MLPGVNDHVVGRDCGITAGPPVPFLTAVKRHIKAVFGTCKQKPWFNGILGKTEHITPDISIVYDPLPAFAHILRPEEIGCIVALPVVVYYGKSLTGIMH